MSRLVSFNQQESNMQRALLNRATMRVANRTDLGGRVIADEVNLDGFHSPIRKGMRLTVRTWLALVTVSLGLYLGLPVCGVAQNDQRQNNECLNEAGINGTYSVHITAYVPGPSGNLVPLAAAGRVTHFANGTEIGVATASNNGQLQTTTFKGTLTLNPDRVSWSETVIQTSAPFFTLHFILYPTPDGNIINEVETDPGTIVSGILTR
jgi:hypothetical protein